MRKRYIDREYETTYGKMICALLQETLTLYTLVFPVKIFSRRCSYPPTYGFPFLSNDPFRNTPQHPPILNTHLAHPFWHPNPRSIFGKFGHTLFSPLYAPFCVGVAGRKMIRPPRFAHKKMRVCWKTRVVAATTVHSLVHHFLVQVEGERIMGFFSHRAEEKGDQKWGWGKEEGGVWKGKGKNEKGGNAREPAITHTRNSHKKKKRKRRKENNLARGRHFGGTVWTQNWRSQNILAISKHTHHTQLGGFFPRMQTFP